MLSAVSLSGSIMNTSQQSLLTERSALASKAAAYDFLMQILYNKSTQECALSNNAQCIDNYSLYYRKVYGISRLSIVRSSEESNFSYVHCENAVNSIICVGVS